MVILYVFTVTIHLIYVTFKMTHPEDKRTLVNLKKKSAASNQKTHRMNTRNYPAEYDGSVSDTTILDSPTKIPRSSRMTGSNVPLRRSSTTLSTALTEALDKKRQPLIDNVQNPANTQVPTPELGAQLGQDVSIPAIVITPNTLVPNDELSTVAY